MAHIIARMIKYSIDKQPLEILKETASKCRDLRKKAGLTQAQLADRSGVSLGSVKRFEMSGQVSLESFLKPPSPRLQRGLSG